MNPDTDASIQKAFAQASLRMRAKIVKVCGTCQHFGTACNSNKPYYSACAAFLVTTEEKQRVEEALQDIE